MSQAVLPFFGMEPVSPSQSLAANVQLPYLASATWPCKGKHNSCFSDWEKARAHADPSLSELKCAVLECCLPAIGCVHEQWDSSFPERLRYSHFPGYDCSYVSAHGSLLFKWVSQERVIVAYLVSLFVEDVQTRVFIDCRNVLGWKAQMWAGGRVIQINPLEAKFVSSF